MPANSPRVSVITPSFAQPEWLRLCLRSVSDQAGVAVEHIVQDNSSGESVAAVCREFPSVRLFQEQDSGMYDAVNRGLRRARGEICAYLNCDEQYLPGALNAVSAYFEAHAEIEVLFADMVVVDRGGGYVCSRQAVMPWRYHSMVCHLPIATAATFFRRSVLDGRGLFFDAHARAFGDVTWVLRLLSEGVRCRVLRTYTSAFTDTGANLACRPESLHEYELIRDQAPRWARWSAPALVAAHRLRRLAAGCYRLAPLSYSIYTLASPSGRTDFRVDRPTFLWKSRFL